MFGKKKGSKKSVAYITSAKPVNASARRQCNFAQKRTESHARLISYPAVIGAAQRCDALYRRDVIYCRHNAIGRVKISLSNWTACRTAIRHPGDFSVRFTRPFSSLLSCSPRRQSERTRRERGRKREAEQSGEAEINCLSAVCLESRARKAPVSTRPVCPSLDRNIVNADRRSLEGPVRNYCGAARRCQVLRNDGKNIYFISRFFRDTVRGNGGQSTDECHVL